MAQTPAGAMRCPCCGAPEIQPGGYLAFACHCGNRPCYACHRCMQHCQCQRPQLDPVIAPRPPVRSPRPPTQTRQFRAGGYGR